MINKLTIDDVPENLKSVACAIGIDAFRSLIKCAGGTSIYLPSERCITKPVRDRVIRESFVVIIRRWQEGLVLVRLGLERLFVKRVKPLGYIQRFYLYFKFALKIQG